MEEPSPSRHRRRERRRRRAAEGAPTAVVEPTPADGTPAAADITVGTAAAAQDATGETAAAAQDATGETAAGQASAAAAAWQASAETAAVPAPGPKRKSRARRTDAERSLRGIVGAGSSQVGVVGAMRARDAARPTADDLAAAERDVVIVRRRYVPPDALPGAR